MSTVASTPTPTEAPRRSANSDSWLRIEPSEGRVRLNLDELWAYRELLFFLTWRDVKIRYKQTVIGIGWAVIQPLLTMVLFTLVFNRVAKLGPEGVPYELWSLVGLVPWTFFQNGLTQSSQSLITNQNLIRKVYFPRLAISIASIMAGFVDFLVAFGLVFIAMAWFGVMPTWNILWLPAFLLLAIATALGVGLWLSAMNVQFRDVKYTVPFLTQMWLYGTPIAWPASALPEEWRTVVGINPMAGVAEGFRWALLGTNTQPGPMILVSAIVALALLVSGAYYFRRLEKTFADVV